ncbi:hypothetical protein M6B38_292025 [Iris pallida]|uniref:Uncharacterized protein n=1 Tax=Iris pallida TaxID=29817 RepID=A0AAX6HVN0_IRIPA|nr:hypothetical protein M6B38_292025 [Iris pallida]
MEEAHKGAGAGVDASIDLLWYDKAIAEDAARSGTSRMTGTGGPRPLRGGCGVRRLPCSQRYGIDQHRYASTVVVKGSGYLIRKGRCERSSVGRRQFRISRILSSYPLHRYFSFFCKCR